VLLRGGLLAIWLLMLVALLRGSSSCSSPTCPSPARSLCSSCPPSPPPPPLGGGKRETPTSAGSVSSASVSTPLDPNVLFSKADCPAVIDAEIKERVLRAHGKLIHMVAWARPDLAHCVSVLGRYVHNPSQKHLDAYLWLAI